MKAQTHNEIKSRNLKYRREIYLEVYRLEDLRREKETAAYEQDQCQTKWDQTWDHRQWCPLPEAIEIAPPESDLQLRWGHRSLDWRWPLSQSRLCSRTWPCRVPPSTLPNAPSRPDCRISRCSGRDLLAILCSGGGPVWSAIPWTGEESELQKWWASKKTLRRVCDDGEEEVAAENPWLIWWLLRRFCSGTLVQRDCLKMSWQRWIDHITHFDIFDFL